VRKDSVDYVIHLGDYIYEYKNGDYGWGDSLGRIPQPDKEIYSLYDYRRRIAQYRTDLDLVASHQAFPWIPVWDDHGMWILPKPSIALFVASLTEVHLIFKRCLITHGRLAPLSSTIPKIPSSRTAVSPLTNVSSTLYEPTLSGVSFRCPTRKLEYKAEILRP